MADLFFYTLKVAAGCPLYCGMQFPGVVGQEELQRHLVELVEQNRLGHAVLLTGRQGSGVLPLAIAFAQYVVSLRNAGASAPPTLDLFGAMSAPPAEAAPAGFSWDPQALQLQHPDLHFSYPVVKAEGKKSAISTDYAPEWRQFVNQQPYGTLFDWLQYIKADNKQGNISVEECSDIIRKLNLRSFKGNYKVLVMWMPEMLGTAGNKLLKLIEEPPDDTLFLLAADNEQDVLGTIVSRCQVIRVPPINRGAIASALAEKTGKPLEEVQATARMSHGSFTEALYLLTHTDHDWNNTLREWLNATLVRGSRIHEGFGMQGKFVQAVSSLGREKQKQLLRYFLEIIEAGVRLRMMPEAEIPLPEDEIEFAKKLNTIAGIAQQKAIAEELEKAIYYIERNANPKLLFHALTLKIQSIVLKREKLDVH